MSGIYSCPVLFFPAGEQSENNQAKMATPRIVPIKYFIIIDRSELFE
jgi:hypothetical protein